eukprot:s2244_g13.t1
MLGWAEGTSCSVLTFVPISRLHRFECTQKKGAFKLRPFHMTAKFVARLIEQARVDTESKVKMELKQIRSTMVAMDERLDQMLAHLDGLQPQENADTLTAEAVAGLLSKTEQQWGQEIRTRRMAMNG